MFLFLTLTNGISAAEISSGIICVCLPTLAALGHRRRRRPSTSILNGQSYPRSPRCFGRDPSTSLSTKALFNTECLEVGENGSRRSDPVSQYAVITTIRGVTTNHVLLEGVSGSDGLRTLEITSSPRSGGDTNSESAIATDGGGGIMKSVRIEQSYVEQV